MFIDCPCGTRNSAFNPCCVTCGAAVVEGPVRGAGAPSSEHAASVLLPGSRVGDYELEALLGSGTLGRVFRARNVGDGSLAALKFLHPHVLQDSDARARFVQEALALRLVEHRSIGKVLDVLETATGPVLALELCAGESLRAYLLRRRVLSPAAALTILRELTLALGALHDAGWVHRDVKPENVMVLDPAADAPHAVRLLDFGLVKSLAPTGWINTAVGTFIGSLAYAAPEQIFGDPVGPQADWWSLGIVACEMLTGRRPFEGASRGEITRTLLLGQLPELGLAPPLGAWVKLLLVKDPKGRPADWREVVRGLGSGA